jgi:hypothetical protein
LTAEVPAVQFPRPAKIPAEVTDGQIVTAVRAFLYGEKHADIAVMLGVTDQLLHSIVRTAEWRHLQVQFRDEFLATTGNRMVRIEQKLLDKIESYIDDGIDAVSMTGEHYIRQLAPKEAVAIAAMLGDTNKRLDRIREGEISRKTFDAVSWRQKLEAIAEKTIEAEMVERSA